MPVDPKSVEVKQVWYPSKDGTRISMFLVHAAGGVRKPAPTLLTGYGGFNICETPVFSPTLFPWFEEGGVFALPNLRGGGEYGDSWHEAGILERKQNVFDDFIAAAEWLIANGYATPGTLAASGGSNGGLLVGAAITQRPDLFRAAIIAVPLLDMLRYQHFLMARYWVPDTDLLKTPGNSRICWPIPPTTRCGMACTIPPCSSRPASTTRACMRCTPGRWRRDCRRRPAPIRPRARCCCGSIARRVTGRASPCRYVCVMRSISGCSCSTS